MTIFQKRRIALFLALGLVSCGAVADKPLEGSSYLSERHGDATWHSDTSEVSHMISLQAPAALQTLAPASSIFFNPLASLNQLQGTFFIEVPPAAQLNTAFGVLETGGADVHLEVYVQSGSTFLKLFSTFARNAQTFEPIHLDLSAYHGKGVFLIFSVQSAQALPAFALVSPKLITLE